MEIKEYIQQQAKKKKILVGESWLPDTQAVIDLMPAPLSLTEKQAIEDFIIAARATAVDNWNEVDEVFFGGFSQDANKLTGWKLGTTAVVRTGAPTSIAGGFSYDGNDDCHDYRIRIGLDTTNCKNDDGSQCMVLLEDLTTQPVFGYIMGFRKRYGTQTRCAWGKQAASIEPWCNAMTPSEMFCPPYTYTKGVYQMYWDDNENVARQEKANIKVTDLANNPNENGRWYVGNANDQPSSGSTNLSNYAECKVGFLSWASRNNWNFNPWVDAVRQLFADVGITI